jgi:KaiC/GvpD/RAD55 family RecA-like ATPase
LEKAREILEKTFPVKYTSAFMVSEYLVWTYIELGEFEKAENLIESLRKTGLEVKDDYLIAEVDALSAMLLRAQKSWKESVKYFEKSLEEHEALNARRCDVYFFAKMVLFEYARLYLERDQEGDKEKVRDLLNQALEIFQGLGAKKDIEKVEAKLLYIETGKAASVPKPAELVCTGYADLDKLLSGGIASNSALVLTSPSCNERDALVKSFLETGAKKGEATFYVTIDASAAKALAEKFVSNLQLFVCNPEADAVIKSSPNVHTLKGVENLTDISIALTSAIRNLDSSSKNPRRICLGLVSDVLLQHHAVETRRWLTALMTKLKSEDFTTLAVVDPKMHPPEELYAILGLFDGEINIYEKGAEQFLKIKRISNQKYMDDELLLKKGDLQKKG